MSKNHHLALILLALGLFVAAVGKPPLGSKPTTIIITSTDSLDAATGLVLDAHLPLIKAQCTGCHSPQLIIQHRFTREEWLSKIRWMQRNHKLWDLGETEKTVLDYLAKYYAPNPAAYSRREALRNIKWYKLESN